MTTIISLGFEGGRVAATARPNRTRSVRETRVALGRGIGERLAGLVLGTMVWSAGIALFVFY